MYPLTYPQKMWTSGTGILMEKKVTAQTSGSTTARTYRYTVNTATLIAEATIILDDTPIKKVDTYTYDSSSDLGSARWRQFWYCHCQHSCCQRAAYLPLDARSGQRRYLPA